MGVVTWLPATVALALVVIGVVPEHDGALYVAAAVLFIVLAALILLVGVFRLEAGWLPANGEGTSVDRS